MVHATYSVHSWLHANGKSTYVFAHTWVRKIRPCWKCEAPLSQTSWGLFRDSPIKIPHPMTLCLMIHMCFHCHTLWIIQLAQDCKLGLRQSPCLVQNLSKVSHTFSFRFYCIAEISVITSDSVQWQKFNAFWRWTIKNSKTDRPINTFQLWVTC